VIGRARTHDDERTRETDRDGERAMPAEAFAEHQGRKRHDDERRAEVDRRRRRERNHGQGGEHQER
jgi:hypothetical protein